MYDDNSDRQGEDDEVRVDSDSTGETRRYLRRCDVKRGRKGGAGIKALCRIDKKSSSEDWT